MRWAGHMPCMWETRNSHRILVDKLGGKNDTNENLRMIILKRILNQMMLSLLKQLLWSSDKLFCTL